MHNPLISICIPAYNAERYIAETLNSILVQTYSNIELIVVNDGSTDNTSQVVQTIRDERLKIIQQGNKGASVSRNEAFGQSKGEYIVFFDADDLIDQDYLYNQMLILNGRTDAVVLAQWRRFNTNDGKIFHLIPNPKTSMSLQAWVDQFWYHVKPMTNPGRILIPRNIIEKAGLWNETLTLNDDMEFYTRVFYHSSEILFNDNSTLYYRSGIGGLSDNKGSIAFYSRFQSIEISSDLVLKNSNSDRTRKSCSNMWQLFIYDTYPTCFDLRKKAEQKIHFLGGSNLRFPAGGKSQFLLRLIGWKATKRIKRVFEKLNHNNIFSSCKKPTPALTKIKQMKRGRFTTSKGQHANFASYIKMPEVIFLAIKRKLFNRYPELPWIPFSATEKLNEIIKKDWRILEIGAGMSTIWMSKRCKEIISIEADQSWFNLLSSKIKQSRIQNIHLRYEWQGDKMADFSEFPDDYFDLIYIDGGPRGLCCENAKSKVKEGGYIYLDNSDNIKLSENGAEVLKESVAYNEDKITYFIDFVPGNIMINEGLLIKT